VFDTVMEYGVTTELLDAESVEGVNAYLDGIDVDLPDAADAIISEYIGIGYSFVISHISNMSRFLSEVTPQSASGQYYYSFGVGMGFHSDKVFYPLKLTSVYGDEVVPMLVQVLDYVSPYSSPRRMSMHMDYLYEREMTFDSSMAGFFNQEEPGEHEGVSLSDIKYTQIVIDSPASTLTDDLWLDHSPTFTARTLEFVSANSWAVSVPIFVISSMLASVLSGLVVFKGYRPAKYKFALLGLLNFTTIIGLWLGARALKIDEEFVGERSKPMIPYTVSSFIVIFAVLFLALVIVSFGSFFVALS
jgi:hypothetical protein